MLIFAHTPFVEALDGHGDMRVLGRQCWGNGPSAGGESVSAGRKLVELKWGVGMGRLALGEAWFTQVVVVSSEHP